MTGDSTHRTAGSSAGAELPRRAATAGERPAPQRAAARLRWLGLGGSALLAVGAYLAGALPGAAPASRAEALWGTGPAFRLGLLAYLVGLVALGRAWWRLGARLRAPGAPSRRWLWVTGLLWALPLLLAPPLGSRDVYAYACQGAVWWDGHDPYAVGATPGGCAWLDAVPDLWRETTSPYGPLALVVSAAAVGLARAVAAGADAQLVVAVGGLRVAAVAGAALVAGFGPRLARACGVAPATAAWLGLVTPLVALHVVSGAHNDALVAGLVVAGLALAVDRRPAVLAAAGAALGLAVAVKVTAVVAVPFAMLLAAGRHGGVGPAGAGGTRADGRPAGHRRRATAVAAVVAAAAAAAFAGLTAVTGLGVGWTGALADTGSLAQWTSLPTGLGMAAGYLLRGLGAPGAYDTAVLVARLLGLAALAGLSAALLLRAFRGRSDARTVVACCGGVLAAVVVLGPVLYPWYAVAPLAVLATAVAEERFRWWLAVVTLGLTALVLPSGLGIAVLTKFPGALLVAAVTAGVSWRWLRRRRRVARPRPDRPRAPHAPDG